MKLINLQIESLIILLQSLKLNNKQSRLRTKFLKLLIEHYDEYIFKNLHNLKLEYAEKDDNGNIIFLDEEKTKFKVNAEYIIEETDLLNEQFIIEFNESNELMLLTISDILLESDFDVEGEISYYYDQWCEECELIIEKYKKLRKDDYIGI